MASRLPFAAPMLALCSVVKLHMPVLPLGGERSFGPVMAQVMRFVASNVEEGIVPGSGYWVMEENPRATIALVSAFLAR